MIPDFEYFGIRPSIEHFQLNVLMLLNRIESVTVRIGSNRFRYVSDRIASDTYRVQSDLIRIESTLLQYVSDPIDSDTYRIQLVVIRIRSDACFQCTFRVLL